jgi:hypothetical protein
MNILQNKTVWIAVALVTLMALTRYNHFGSSVALPDASYAVFFLGGLFLSRVRGALLLLAGLLVEAVLVDFYAINYQGVSSACVTPAYAFLAIAYAAMWFVASRYAPRHQLTLASLLGLVATAVAASTLAFVIANASLYLLGGYAESLSAVEYAVRVAQYFGSYVVVAMVYIGCGIVAQAVYGALRAKIQHDSTAV